MPYQVPYIDPRVMTQLVEAQRMAADLNLHGAAAIIRNADFDFHGAAAIIRNLESISPIFERFGDGAVGVTEDDGAIPSYVEAPPALLERDLPLWVELAPEPVWRAWLEENL